MPPCFALDARDQQLQSGRNRHAKPTTLLLQQQSHLRRLSATIITAPVAARAHNIISL